MSKKDDEVNRIRGEIAKLRGLLAAHKINVPPEVDGYAALVAWSKRKENGRITTKKDVAAQFGVSVSAVSREIDRFRKAPDRFKRLKDEHAYLVWDLIANPWLVDKSLIVELKKLGASPACMNIVYRRRRSQNIKGMIRRARDRREASKKREMFFKSCRAQIDELSVRDGPRPINPITIPYSWNSILIKPKHIPKDLRGKKVITGKDGDTRLYITSLV